MTPLSILCLCMLSLYRVVLIGQGHVTLQNAHS